MFSHSVLSDSLWPHGLQHVRTFCSSPPPKDLHRLISIESVMPSYCSIICQPLLSIFPSIRVFSNELVLPIRWPKYWSFSFSISPSNEYLGLISFRIDSFDLLAVQGTLKTLLKYHIPKASILQHSAFFMVQLSHPYITTGKTIVWGALSVPQIISPFAPSYWQLLWVTLFIQIFVYIKVIRSLLTSRPDLACLRTERML